MSLGIKLISEERKRQIEKEGWTAKHDAQHEDKSLSLVAALYATPIPLYSVNLQDTCVRWFDPWPWRSQVEPPRGGPLINIRAWDKREKHSRLKKLVIAGALIAAEIDRIKTDFDSFQ